MGDPQVYTATDGSGSDRARKVVRYWLARIRTEVSGGSRADDAPDDLRAKFEAMPMFQVAGGWMGYRVSWDVGPEGKDMIGLKMSQWESWHNVCQANAKELPSAVKVEPLRENKAPFEQHSTVVAPLEID